MAASSIARCSRFGAHLDSVGFVYFSASVLDEALELAVVKLVCRVANLEVFIEQGRKLRR